MFDQHATDRAEKRNNVRALKPFTIGSVAGTPHQGEIWLADSLPFVGGAGSKSRPVLVKGRNEESYICFKCTSQISASRRRYRIKNLTDAGLNKISYLDYDPITIPRNRLVYRIGMMSEEDIEGFGMF